MITIIGGGIFGLAIGWYLAQANHKVILFEKGQVGQGATQAAAGMLMPWKLSRSFNMDLFIAQRYSHALWPTFAQELVKVTNIDLNYQTDGRYFVAMDNKAVKRFRQQFAFHQQQNIPVEWLTGKAVRNREPQLGPNVSAAIFSPFGHRVNSKQVVLALQQAFLQAGGVLYQRTPVIDIVIEHQKVQAVQLAHKTLATKTIINAAGAWSSQFAGLPAGLQNLIEPLKGQTITMQMPPRQPLIQRPIIGPVYLVPHSNGKLVLGTTVEEGAGFDTRPTSEGIDYILAKALEIVPGIKKLPIIEKKVGLRPTGPGRLPVLGPTAINGLIMASGGHSYGILLTPLVAHGIRQLVTTGQVPDIITPFLPTI